MSDPRIQYDWRPNHRGDILEEQATKGERRTIIVRRAGVLQELLKLGMLTGEAKQDAMANCEK